MKSTNKIALGGGCHWCTEAIFKSLIGVSVVEQGFVASMGKYNAFSEAVIVHFNEKEIALSTLIKIHLVTHQSTTSHSMRHKYRSAIYTFSITQKLEADAILINMQGEFDQPILTKTLPFVDFKPSEKQFVNYYYKNPDKPFCKRFINPKLKFLINHYSKNVETKKLNNLMP